MSTPHACPCSRIQRPKLSSPTTLTRLTLAQPRQIFRQIAANAAQHGPDRSRLESCGRSGSSAIPMISTLAPPMTTKRLISADCGYVLPAFALIPAPAAQPLFSATIFWANAPDAIFSARLSKGICSAAHQAPARRSISAAAFFNSYSCCVQNRLYRRCACRSDEPGTNNDANLFDRHNLLENSDGDQIGQMHAVVLLLMRRRYQIQLDVIVDHGRG